MCQVTARFPFDGNVEENERRDHFCSKLDSLLFPGFHILNKSFISAVPNNKIIYSAILR